MRERAQALGRTLALELGPYGVTSNAIRPRAGTRMAGAVDMKKALDLARQGKLPLPDFMFEIEDMAEGSDTFTPELVSPLVVFLCTDAAAHVNGRDFIVGGGEISLVSLPEKQRSVFTGSRWSQDELQKLLPKTLVRGLRNPAAPR